MFLALAIICDDYFVPALEEISSVVPIMMRSQFFSINLHHLCVRYSQLCETSNQAASYFYKKIR